ncbi:MAG TPA: NADPH-dependent glutamate synthase [Methanomassiliicoccales archaeon]|nr:NADPH-dependent glutamate synthase [Methanomassiliicoccales archaeon]HPD08770.1 NADPH-dependent glutamate synthase [Methanomassiliicoccales archaeon]
MAGDEPSRRRNDRALDEDVPMPRQDPKERVKNFKEVALGYTEEMAVAEARRCLKCKSPQCQKGCPVEVPIPQFIDCIVQGRYEEGIALIKSKNALPAVCGRVCPQEQQCQMNCVRGKRGDPVNIGRLERFLADWEREHGVRVPERPAATGRRVAIIGAGPSGLTAASDLARLGHGVTLFEALHVAGGVLMYGIPEFRLPKEIVQREVEYVQSLGVDLRLGNVIGRIATIPELLEQGYDAVYIASGAGLPQWTGCPGENLGGIYSANEFLIRANLMKAYRFPETDTPLRIGKHVVVIGGGNVAMDCARISMRLGAKVCLNYRRSRNELPARREEIENAEEEGLTCNFLNAPAEFYGDEKGWVRAMRCTCMELTEPDERGRTGVRPIACSDFEMETDTVIVAIGQTPNPIIQRTTEGLRTNPRNGTIIVDEDGRTNLEGVFAGGDVATGAATVISAMGAGKRTARAIHEYLTTGPRGDRT